MWMKKGMVVITLGVLTACSTGPQGPNFDDTLYAGKPVDSLTSDAPPKTEKEAITRGDVALSKKNVDLALYEYIRSLSFQNAQYKDQTLYTIGRIHLTREDNALAEKAFLASIDANPNFPGSLEELGVMYAKLGRKDEAMGYFLKAINADQIRLGGKPDLTLSNLNEDKVAQLKEDAKSPLKALVGIGVLYDVKDEHVLAQSLYNKALSANAQNVSALVNLGYSYYMSDEYNDAEQYTNRALSLDPGNERAINNLALIYISKGKMRQALNIFSRHMSEPEALNNIGYFLILQDRPEEAIPYLQEAIDKSPSYYPVANENLERALAEVREMDIKT